jgi:hypothetical protein
MEVFACAEWGLLGFGFAGCCTENMNLMGYATVIYA